MDVRRKYDYRYWLNKNVYTSRYNIDLATCQLSDRAPNIEYSNWSIEKQNPVWKENIRRNCSRGYVTEDKVLHRVYGEWDGLDVLVVGAGQSAKNNPEFIKWKQDSGWKIVACDRILAFLKKNGITPDFTVSVDSLPVVASYIACLDKGDRVALSVMQDVKTLEMAKVCQADAYYYAPANPFTKLTPYIQGKFPEGICCLRSEIIVGFAATHLAIMMGGKTVAFIGNELCWFSEDDVEPLYRDNWKYGYKKSAWASKDRTLYTIDPFIRGAHVMSFLIKQYEEYVRFVDYSDGVLPIEQLSILTEMIMGDTINSDIYMEASNEEIKHNYDSGGDPLWMYPASYYDPWTGERFGNALATYS